MRMDSKVRTLGNRAMAQGSPVVTQSTGDTPGGFRLGCSTRGDWLED